MSKLIIDTEKNIIELTGTFTGHDGRDYPAKYTGEIDNGRVYHAKGKYYDGEEWVDIEDCGSELKQELQELIPIEDKKFCACCQGNTISEDPAAAKHDLCDRCYDRFNQRDYDDFIAARKGE